MSLPATESVPDVNLPRPASGVVFCEVDDGAVLLSVERELYFALNPVGARVWRLLPPTSRTLEELVMALLRDFPDAPADLVREDVAQLLRELEREQLVAHAA